MSLRDLFSRHRATRAPSGSGGRSMRELVSAANTYREQYNPLRSLTIARAISLLEQAQRGEYADTMWTYHFIEMTNPTLLALCERRESSLVEMDYDIKIASEEKHPSNWDEKLAEDQRAALAAVYEQIDNLYAAIAHLSSATFRSFAHVQAHLTTSGNPTHLEVLDQWNFAREGLYGPWHWNKDSRQAITYTDETRLDPERDMLIIRERRRHVDRPGLVMFVRQNLSEKDWDGFVEIYGIPSPVIIGPPDVPTDKEDEYEEAAANVANGGSGYLPNGSEVKYPNEARATSPFEARLDWLQKQMILVGTGGMLTMLAESGSGTLAGGAHSETFRSLARAEAQEISEVLQGSIDRWVLDRMFPGRPRLAYFAMAANDERDVGDIVDHAAKLAPVGYMIDVDELSEKTGYRITFQAPAPKPPDPSNPDVMHARHRAASVQNRDDDTTAALIENGIEAAIAAERADMRGLAERLYAILNIQDDPTMFQAAAAQLRADIPRLADQINAYPELATAIERCLGPALVNGIALGVADRTTLTQPMEQTS